MWVIESVAHGLLDADRQAITPSRRRRHLSSSFSDRESFSSTSCALTPEKRRVHASMHDQRLPNRENHRQLEGVSAPPAINIRVPRNKGNMPSANMNGEIQDKIKRLTRKESINRPAQMLPAHSPISNCGMAIVP